MALVINRVPLLIFRKRIFVIDVNKVYILFIHYFNAAVFQGAASDFPHHESAAELR